MKKNLTKKEYRIYYIKDGVRIKGVHSKISGNARYIRGDVSSILGDVSDIEGDVSGISGNVSFIRGNVSGIKGDANFISGDVSGIKGDVSSIRGNVSGILGDVSSIGGYVSGILGDVSGIRVDLNTCEITEEDRENGIDIDLLKDIGFTDIELGFNIDKLPELDACGEKEVECPKCGFKF